MDQRNENDRRNYFMIYRHEIMGLSRDRTRDPSILYVYQHARSNILQEKDPLLKKSTNTWIATENGLSKSFSVEQI